MQRSHRLLAGLAALVSFGVAADARAESGGVKAGVLTCNVSEGWGLIFGSSRDLKCTFSPDSKRVENYTGKINKFGIDIGFQKGGVMVWAVLAPTSQLAPGTLQGDFGGVSAGAAAGVGGSANVLVGGSNKTISLSPLSIEGAPGVNIAAGVASMKLTYKP